MHLSARLVDGVRSLAAPRVRAVGDGGVVWCPNRSGDVSVETCYACDRFFRVGSGPKTSIICQAMRLPDPIVRPG